MKSKSMQDFSNKSFEKELPFESSTFKTRATGRVNAHDDLEIVKNDKKVFLSKDKHPNVIEKGELTLSGMQFRY